MTGLTHSVAQIMGLTNHNSYFYSWIKYMYIVQENLVPKWQEHCFEMISSKIYESPYPISVKMLLACSNFYPCLY